MPSNKDFAMRVEIIDECLRNNQRKWVLHTLITEVNRKLEERYGKTASRRTIQNDIKFLTEEKGAPIIKTKEGHTTYFSYRNSAFSIKNLPIQKEEVTLLKDAIHMLSQVSDFQIIRDVEDVIVKLQNTINTDIEKGPPIMHFEKHTTSIGTEYIDDLFTAIKNKTALRITYQPFKAAVASECVFHPYLLKEYRNRWFLIGAKNAKKQILNFALDRIKAIRNSSAEYMPNDLFDTNTYFNNLIGVTVPKKAAAEAIRIKVSADQVPYIKTKPIHHSQNIIEEFNNGDMIIEVSVIINYELTAVLLSYGCDIVVLHPDSLRKNIKNIYRKGTGCYK